MPEKIVQAAPDFVSDLASLAPTVEAMIERLAQEIVSRMRSATRSEIALEIGMTPNAIRRANVYFTTNVSAAKETATNGAGFAFGAAFCLGEQAALRRAMSAISSPEAKGREAEVLAALMHGAEIEEALASVRNADTQENVTRANNVVTLRNARRDGA